MAAVPATSKNVAGAFTATSILLATSGDTLVYNSGAGDDLVLCNTSASPVVVTVDGSAGTTVVVPGTAGTTLSVASGLAITVAANSYSILTLDKASSFLQGTVAISAATGAVVRAAIVTQS
jgi:hypothetical protein